MTEAASERRPAEPPPQVTMGLLDYLTTYALDQDYAHVAEQRRHGVRPPRRGRLRGLSALAAGAILATLMVVAVTQTSRNATAAAGERQDLVEQVRQRQRVVTAEQVRARALLASVGRLRARGDEGRLPAGLAERRATLSLLAGTEPATGPGVRVAVDDARRATSERQQVQDKDLRRLVNGLWQAGAEAISINGYRLTTLSAIRQAGGAITVNYHSLPRPYVVLAIGDPDTMPARFANTVDGQVWLDLEQQVGLRFTMQARRTISLPAVPLPRLREARATKPGGASAGGHQ